MILARLFSALWSASYIWFYFFKDLLTFMIIWLFFIYKVCSWWIFLPNCNHFLQEIWHLTFVIYLKITFTYLSTSLSSLIMLLKLQIEITLDEWCWSPSYLYLSLIFLSVLFRCLLISAHFRPCYSTNYNKRSSSSWVHSPL